MGPQTHVIGRESELSVIRDFVLGDGRGAMVLAGPAGIGKTTLWEAAIDLARERGLRIMTARASGAEAQLSFSALIDLCDEVTSGDLDDLPAPQRTALEAALLRSEPGELVPNPQAIALGFRNVVRRLAEHAPVLIAIDDVQWLDAASLEVLSSLARRHGESARFVLTRRGEVPTMIERVLDRAGLKRIVVGPLSLGAIGRLLADRLGLGVSRQRLRRIVDVTLANPLFALELGRELITAGVPPDADELPIPAGIEDILGMRVGALPASQRRILVALALSGELALGDLISISSQEAVEDAIDGDLVRVDAGRVRAAHPLFAAAAVRSVGLSIQHELHLALADVRPDVERRAMHLAAACDAPDAELSASVAEAAAAASSRGARQRAVTLAEHALRLTPTDSALRGQRVLLLAEYLESAGELRRLTDLLTPEVESLPAGEPRARAWLMLSEGAGFAHMDDLADLRRRALIEAADHPGVRARVLAKQASNAAASAISDLPQAQRWASAAVVAAAGEGTDVQRVTLYALAWTRAMTGHAVDDLCERSRAIADQGAYIAAAPERVAGQRLVWRGEIDEARARLTGLLRLADERGEIESYALMRLHACELHLRTGDWDAAEVLLDEWSQSADRELMFRPKYERCRALLAAGRGDLAETERWGTLAVARGIETGCRWDEFEGTRARAVGLLLARQFTAAVEILQPVWRSLEREGVQEPGVFPVAPDLLEALVELDELQEAESIIALLTRSGEEQAHPWAMISAARCAGLVQLRRSPGDPDARDAVERSAAAYEELGLPFDAARTRLSLSRAQRRVRQWGSARHAMERALEAFEAIGSPGWAQQARTELDRVGPGRGRPSSGLTQSEQRAAELAAAGMSNKQIAAQLVVTVHTVEVHLSRAYAKLGVQSRGQLRDAMGASAVPED